MNCSIGLNRFASAAIDMRSDTFMKIPGAIAILKIDRGLDYFRWCKPEEKGFGLESVVDIFTKEKLPGRAYKNSNRQIYTVLPTYLVSVRTEVKTTR